MIGNYCQGFRALLACVGELCVVQRKKERKKNRSIAWWNTSSNISRRFIIYRRSVMQHYLVLRVSFYFCFSLPPHEISGVNHMYTHAHTRAILGKCFCHKFHLKVDAISQFTICKRKSLPMYLIQNSSKGIALPFFSSKRCSFR